ncbi:DUF2207 domain-containing protein [Microbacterium thalli]|uniref:DUF2207 domain-containing protein n=1 Tax=Microbacterium thalli TaxID=3027921 RepID=UPI0023653CAF|nr:DUF2207 domain-containing protein [Microbacterium thalli]MDD7928903.1 DUF2207 domain-containing protein [Microbacterium thalli]
MMRRTRRVLASATVVLVTSLLAVAVPTAASAAPPVTASVASDTSGDLDAFVFDSLTVDYFLERDADGTARMRVVERFVADFPETDQNRGMRRLIPESYNGQPLHPALVSVTDENGDPRPVETDSDDGTLGILTRGSDYLHGLNTFVFTYDLENVVWDFDDTGLEFYWDVNGTDWAQPFREVTATLHLAPPLVGSLSGSQSCYVGASGETRRCVDLSVSADGATVSASDRELAPHETLTLAVGFDAGTFEIFDTAYFSSPFGWLQVGSLAALAGATGWALRNRRRSLGDEGGRPTIIAEYEPPREIDALESAVLLGKTSAAIPAEVLEQAIVGSIRILDGEPGRWGTSKLRAELVDPDRADENGRMLLRALFPQLQPGDVYSFGSSDTRLSSTAQGILKSAGERLTALGMYRPVRSGTRGWPIAVWAVAAGLTILFGILALLGFVHPAVPIIGIALAASSFFVVLIAMARVPLSATGAEARDHLRGVEQFICWAEADRIRVLQSPSGAERVAIDTDDPRQMLRLYERLLPYAVVFGQEKQWAQHLTVLYAAAGVTAPVWYAGTGAFDASSFAAGIGTLSSSAASSSSTSGGSSGGGAAGGGGGGGGGGGA